MTLAGNDTIVAPITGTSGGAVQVLRVSGPDTPKILGALVEQSSQVLSQPRTLFLRKLLDETAQALDEGLVVFFSSAASYTGEDSAEIHLHASPYIVRRFLEALNCLGARNAEAGEFTKRAFLNGKIDLSQAEAVSDIILAETEAQARVAREQLSGRLSNALSELGEPLRNIMAEIEAYIDFPDEDIEPATQEVWIAQMRDTKQQLERYLATYSQGRICREGAQVVLAGLPNAGKSSLLNAFVGSERAIVTAIAGTTRDTIEERISLQGIFVRLWDTAGLVSESESARKIDEIERKGIELSWNKIKEADIVLFLVDPSQDLESQISFFEQIEKNTSATIIRLLNKSDILETSQRAEIDAQVSDYLEISAKSGIGIDRLCEKMGDLLHQDTQGGSLLICTARHRESLADCLESICKAITSVELAQPAELVAFDLRQGLGALSEIVGATPTEDILGRIFSKFCIGK